jgi:hypothetical protein
VIAGNLIYLKFSEVIRKLGNIFGRSAGMSILVWMTGIMLPDGWHHWAYIVVQVPLGILIYTTMVHVLQLNAYIEICDFVKERVLVNRFGFFTKKQIINYKFEMLRLNFWWIVNIVHDTLLNI